MTDAADHYRVLTMAHPELRDKHGRAKLAALAAQLGVDSACAEIRRLCGDDAVTRAMVDEIQHTKETT